MKEFAHPDAKRKAPADLNRGVQNTLVIAANEYRFVASVKTDYGVLPLVECHIGEINQVVLNIVVSTVPTRSPTGSKAPLSEASSK